ncbi:hypothetical protein P3L10_026412 [Capsicum annuum]
MTMIGGLRCHFGERNSVFHSAHYFRWTDNEEAVRFAQMMIPVLPLLLFLLSGSSVQLLVRGVSNLPMDRDGSHIFLE